MDYEFLNDVEETSEVTQDNSDLYTFTIEGDKVETIFEV
jgi:hypothetical protein